MWIWWEWLYVYDVFVYFLKVGYSYFCFYLFGKNSCLFWKEVWELICVEFIVNCMCFGGLFWRNKGF